MSGRITFSQLWLEEEEFLWERSKDFPPQTTLVEIGTGQGGSAFIFSWLPTSIASTVTFRAW